MAEWQAGQRMFQDSTFVIKSLPEHFVGTMGFVPRVRWTTYGPKAGLMFYAFKAGSVLLWYTWHANEAYKLDDDLAGRWSVVGSMVLTPEAGSFVGDSHAEAIVYGKPVVAGDEVYIAQIGLGGLAFSLNTSFASVTFPFALSMPSGESIDDVPRVISAETLVVPPESVYFRALFMSALVGGYLFVPLFGRS